MEGKGKGGGGENRQMELFWNTERASFPPYGTMEHVYVCEKGEDMCNVGS